MFVITILFDLILGCAIIGFFLIPIHILSHMNQSLIIGTKSLVLKTGILSTHTHEIRYSKINSITVNRGILGSLLGFGTITIFAGNDVSGLKFKNLDSPDKVKREIDEMIEKNP